MFCYRQMGILLIGLFPLLSLAQPFTIDPQSEALYQKALPYLQQAGDKLDAVPANTPTADAKEKQRAVVLIEAAGLLLRSAVPLLEQAAALAHPVAQYRLALIYLLVDSNGAASQKACPLIEQSLIHGFAPSALLASSWCSEFTQTAEYQAALANMGASRPLYERYYPQPAVFFECRQQMPTGMGFLYGGSGDFQAEIYRLQGDSNRSQRRAFYEKAVAINDCYRPSAVWRYVPDQDEIPQGEQCEIVSSPVLSGHAGRVCNPGQK